VKEVGQNSILTAIGKTLHEVGQNSILTAIGKTLHEAQIDFLILLT
jgi:hypothetical protein